MTRGTRLVAGGQHVLTPVGPAELSARTLNRVHLLHRNAPSPGASRRWLPGSTAERLADEPCVGGGTGVASTRSSHV